MIRINYKAYEKISVIFMGLTYFCLLFRVDLVFENFLASVFSIIAAISCRTYYTMENRILYKKNPQTKEIKEKIDKNNRDVLYRSHYIRWAGHIFLHSRSLQDLGINIVK